MICESRGLDRVCQSTGSMYYNVADSVFPMLALQSTTAAGQADSSLPLPAIHGERHCISLVIISFVFSLLIVNVTSSRFIKCFQRTCPAPRLLNDLVFCAYTTLEMLLTSAFGRSLLLPHCDLLIAY